MNDRDTRRTDRADNVTLFGDNNIDDHRLVLIVQEHIDKIKARREVIRRAVAGQAPNLITKSSVLDAHLLDFKSIASTARGIELRSKEVGFAVPFNHVPPRIEKDIRTYADSLLALLEDNNAPVADGGDTAEQKLAKAALRARFLELAINPAFVTNLRHDRDLLDELNKHNTTEVQEGTEDTALISSELTAINTEVDILDPIFSNLYEHNPEKLHAWKRASRVERNPQRGKSSDPATPPV